jgi:hypothetical protein
MRWQTLFYLPKNQILKSLLCSASCTTWSNNLLQVQANVSFKTKHTWFLECFLGCRCNCMCCTVCVRFRPCHHLVVIFSRYSQPLVVKIFATNRTDPEVLPRVRTWELATRKCAVSPINWTACHQQSLFYYVVQQFPYLALFSAAFAAMISPAQAAVLAGMWPFRRPLVLSIVIQVFGPLAVSCHWWAILLAVRTIMMACSWTFTANNNVWNPFL